MNAMHEQSMVLAPALCQQNESPGEIEKVLRLAHDQLSTRHWMMQKKSQACLGTRQSSKLAGLPDMWQMHQGSTEHTKENLIQVMQGADML